MTRELKFRAWDKTEKKMNILGEIGICQEYSCITFTNEEHRICDWPLGDNETLENQIIMQYINMKDKNDKEIYEDDIAEMRHDKHVYWRRVVRWESITDPELGGEIGRGFDTGFEASEVIGNIHQNPELLERPT